MGRRMLLNVFMEASFPGTCVLVDLEQLNDVTLQALYIEYEEDEPQHQRRRTSL
jgi:hypothetical protein